MDDDYDPLWIIHPRKDFCLEMILVSSVGTYRQKKEKERVTVQNISFLLS